MHDLKNTRILIIDDNKSVIDDFKKILTAEIKNDSIIDFHNALFDEKKSMVIVPSYEIDTALQGLEGIELVKNAVKEARPYAMAFVDILMPPGIDGVETIKRIWKEDSEIQIAICTAYANYSWKDIVNELGLSDQLLILKKPFESIEIKQIASCLVKKWNLNQQVGHQYDKTQNILLKQASETQKNITSI